MSLVHDFSGEESKKANAIRFDLSKTIYIEQNSNYDQPVVLSDVFYVQTDYDLIMAENQATVQMIVAKGDIQDEESFCHRGLEKKRRDIRRMAQEAVLEEQWRLQRANDDDHDVVLAEMYKGFTSVCEVMAKRRGKMDSLAAKQFQMSDECPRKTVSNSLLSDAGTESTQDVSEPFSSDDDAESSGDIAGTFILSETSDDIDTSNHRIRPSFFGRMFRHRNQR